MKPRNRAEGVILVMILLVVGGAAGAASFTHVHDWTMANSPAGTPDWFGWANACISELVPVAALLEIRRRRRSGDDYRYPLAILIAAALLSLSAQIAVAKPSASGWLLSAVPALAFMALVKLIFTSTPVPVEPATMLATPHGEPNPAPVPAYRPAVRRRPYPRPVPPGARLLPIVPRVAPPPAPVPRAAWLETPLSARRLPIVPRVAPSAPRPSRPRSAGWVCVPSGARTLPIAPKAPATVTRIRASRAGRPLAETKQLAERIIAEERAAGRRITQAQLAERLGISRRTLRDALALSA